MNSGSARLQALTAAVLFSTGGAGIKVESFSGIQVSCLRSGIAAIVLLVWLARARTSAPALTLSLPVLGTGVVYATCLTLFVLATKLTTAANAIFLQSTFPIYILLLSPWLIGERLHRRDVAYFLALAAGLTLCFAGRLPATSTAPDPATGNLLALVCSVAWAVTLLALRYIQRDDHRSGVGTTAVATGNVFAFLAALPFAWPFPPASAEEWATVTYLGVFQIGVAYVFLTSALRTLSAVEASLLLLIEPVLNPVWTWLIRGEHPGRWAIVGGTIVLAATAIKAVYDARALSQRGDPGIGIDTSRKSIGTS